ncbi:hypothetical protein DVH24_011105 [Malus domestica]|uniref:non-specific serine/threonine protein kinase n=1 Tax=Malus domestica TaxID=3750 RepID=A0A498JTI8_MALDO|nr:hypothetical protein DVH24_011105 [Malus domestica]
MHDSASRNISVGCISSRRRGEQVLHMYNMKMKLMMRILLLCFLSCFWFQLSLAQNATTDPSEVRALNSIFEQWDTQPVPGLWNISGEPCSGSALNAADFESPNDDPDINPAIECDCTYDNSTTCHITKLRVYAPNKRGVFPEEFVAQRYLTTLRIDYNYFTGPLPAFIGNMSAMTVLYIRFNSFSGPIPKELGNLKELTVLDIGSNNFSGTLPPELGNLVKLEQMRFHGNSFEGPIPTSFSQLTSLLSLAITDIYNGNSSFDFIKNLKNLTNLELRNALITGTIPSDIGEYQSLQKLYTAPLNLSLVCRDLSFNNLTGQLPSSLFTMSSLTSLFLGNNSLSGPLPSQKSDQLQTIDLSYNFLSGSFPDWGTTLSLQLNLVVNNFTFDSSNRALPRLNCLQRNFPCNRNPPICNLLLSPIIYYFNDTSYCKHVFVSSVIRMTVSSLIMGRFWYYMKLTDANFAINCGGLQTMGRDGILYEAEYSALGPATFSVTGTSQWAVSNAGLFYIGNQSFLVNTDAQVTGTDVTPELFQTSRVSAGSLRYYGLEHCNIALCRDDSDLKDTRMITYLFIWSPGYPQEEGLYISKEAGGVNRAVVRKFNVSVSKNYLEIHLFWAGKGTCCIPNYGDYGPLIAAVHAASVSGLPPTTPGKKSKTGLIVGIAVPVGVVSLLLIFVILYMRRKKSEKEDDEAATEDFNPSNKLGEGGYGPVYKGTLSDGRVVAVKQLSVASHQGKSQFVSEIATIYAVQHRNLVKLYGCCIEGSHLILVYEYLENKSLDHALFGTSNLHLDWPTRFNILLGTARGLAYLHEESRPRIVHRDVKASNILLDAKLSPKISDFGLAKLYDDEKTHISTRVAGTIGYLAPEYALFGHLTEKVDVFGFGVVVLEILSGRPNSYNNLDPEKIYLLEWVWTLHENDQTLGLVDPRLTEFDETEATRLIRASLLCTQGSPMARPSMSRVVAMLSGDIDIGTVMSKPNYLTDYNFKDVTTFSIGRFLVEDDTPSTASKHSNVHLNYQPEGSNASGANTPGVDPTPSPVNVTQSLLAGIIEEGR